MDETSRRGQPSIGHLKNEHRLERNRLKGVAGDAINAILAAAAMNFQKLLGTFWRYFLSCLIHFCKRILSLQGLPARHVQFQNG
jgi:transposase, IS5 family